jgi:hypothetical protein
VVVDFGCPPGQEACFRPGIDNSVSIRIYDDKARESLAQYISRCPVSLEKIAYEAFHNKVLFKTPKYNTYFKENLRVFDVLDFMAEVTSHIPPKHKQLIRRYGLYASRSRGKWDGTDHVVRLAPEGWKEKKEIEAPAPKKTEEQENAVGNKKQRSTWAKLIKRVYGIDPLICPKCGTDMKIIAIIMEPVEIDKIMHHLKKIGRALPVEVNLN